MVRNNKDGRTLLHTGDFRYRPQILEDMYACIPDVSIDWLYLDNTFGTSDEAFPSQ